ncbi:transcription factor IIIA-like [Apium graveolens]|uniref:transcription factor IIIA-like n=1 Tax=Apium graveolens TaxID=4045 RepID=UPI003D7B9342
MEVDGTEKKEGPIFRDIRRYYCEYCGICRSKKSLISSHIVSHHQDEVNERTADENEEKEGLKSNTCDECGLSFQKPAHLKQHMQSHSLERPFTCPIDDCHSSYRRKDHLNRHLLQHQGKLFECPSTDCNRRFTIQGNMKRHVKEFHNGSSPFDVEAPKEYICPEPGCRKVFKYASKLRKHEDSHVKFESSEAFCTDPGCMKCFTNEQCLKAHIQSCHRHISCDFCGTKQLKKNIKRHLLTHEVKPQSERIKCSISDCLHTFSSKSNLSQHMKAVHLQQRPFACSIYGCGMRFTFKHVRDKHEKSGCHLYIQGDFVETDEQFRSHPRGGRKRVCPTIEAFMSKRIVPPSPESGSIIDQGPDYNSWLLLSENHART